MVHGEPPGQGGWVTVNHMLGSGGLSRVAAIGMEAPAGTQRGCSTAWGHLRDAQRGFPWGFGARGRRRLWRARGLPAL